MYIPIQLYISIFKRGPNIDNRRPPKYGVYYIVSNAIYVYYSMYYRETNTEHSYKLIRMLLTDTSVYITIYII